MIRVPDEIRKGVAFLMVSSTGREADVRPVGTAFWIQGPTGERGGARYLVTARHVIDSARAKGFEELWLRVDTAAGGVEFLRVPHDDWCLADSTDCADDVAVLELTLDARYDYATYPFRLLGSGAMVQEAGVDAGDPVFMPGLFATHYGRERNRPIVRWGSIAAMADEPIPTRLGNLEAYLIEVRSIGGLSGSPVFVSLDPDGANMFKARLSDEEGRIGYFLLGLIHGHFDVQAPATTEATGVERMNMGIAMVVPSERILRILAQPEVEDRRQRGLTRFAENYRHDMG